MVVELVLAVAGLAQGCIRYVSRSHEAAPDLVLTSTIIPVWPLKWLKNVIHFDPRMKR